MENTTGPEFSLPFLGIGIKTKPKPVEVQPPVFIGWFPNQNFLVGVYHLPKGTTIFEMVVDFQGNRNLAMFPLARLNFLNHGTIIDF